MVAKLNDKLMLTDVITHLKDIMTLTGTAVKESNCEKQRAMLTAISGRVEGHQFEVFQYMNKNGMYPVENATAAQIKQVLMMHGATAK